MKGKISAVNSSKEKGVVKRNIGSGILRKNFGLVGDAHSGTTREVSLLGWERVQRWLRAKSIEHRVKPGDFAENITTEGIDWSRVKIGDRIRISRQSIAHSPQPIILEVSQIGKECHSGCAIRKIVGDCLMPREGVFAKVIKGGKIKVGDKVSVTPHLNPLGLRPSQDPGSSSSPSDPQGEREG